MAKSREKSREKLFKLITANALQLIHLASSWFRVARVAWGTSGSLGSLNAARTVYNFKQPLAMTLKFIARLHKKGNAKDIEWI